LSVVALYLFLIKQLILWRLRTHKSKQTKFHTDFFHAKGESLNLATNFEEDVSTRMVGEGKGEMLV